ncbi:MAG: hypothetical protein JW787_14590 [Sedimentisphaerales bacterium]|nr:hypothetical protein [Sedimentisphaerales bacterium]
MRLRLLIIVFVLVFGLCGSPLFADFNGNLWTGSLSSENESIILGGKWSDFSISWDINPMDGLDNILLPESTDIAYYQYTYNISAKSPSTSHLIIQVSDTFNTTIDEMAYINNSLLSGTGFLSSWGLSESNPGFPVGETIWGIKFEDYGEYNTLTFNSLREPVWGDFYAKGGSNSFAYNSGLTGGDGFIATIDTHMVPLPATILLGLLGLGVGGWKLRKSMK